jgi:hypothetical protein
VRNFGTSISTVRSDVDWGVALETVVDAALGVAA